MSTNSKSISRPAITKLLIGAVVMLGLLGLFVALAGNASAGGDTKITVNSTANIDDGECEGAPNDDEIGNCTLHEAIDMVNNGDADIINFHKPVFSKEQPGVINLCASEGAGQLPPIERDIVIDSKNSGVILDGRNKDDCISPTAVGLEAEGFNNGFDFELNGGKNFTIRNFAGEGILICAGGCSIGGQSLGTIKITGVIVENVEGVGILIAGSNLENGSITNSEISSNGDDGVAVIIDACEGNDCLLTDSALDISGNRVEGGKDNEEAGAVAGCCKGGSGVFVVYEGTLNIDEFPAGAIGGGTKITASVSQNESINGFIDGVALLFFGCGQDAGVNFHVDENEDVNGIDGDGVLVVVDAGVCEKPDPGCSGACIDVGIGDTSDNLEVVVTVNGNGDIENHGAGGYGVLVRVGVCCEGSDSSATVEVNDNGRITGELFGVGVETFICCGDDNLSDVSVNGNDEVTGEGASGIAVEAFAGSNAGASLGGVAGGGTGFDADDNICRITIDGNNEVDGVGEHGMNLECLAGTLGGEELLILAGAALSSGDQNIASIVVSNNEDIDGNVDGVFASSAAGSADGEGDENLATVSVIDNGEITGDDGHGVEAFVLAGSQAEEGDDNVTEIVISGNAEIGGNGGDGLNLNSLSGGITAGSEDNSTSVLVDQNGSIEGSGGDGESIAADDGGDGIDINTLVCCDEANTNTITITNNKDEITGHDGDGIDIGGFPAFGAPIFDGVCCSVNIITIADNAGNIRGGDDDGLELQVCVTTADFGTERTMTLFPTADEPCIAHSVTQLTVINNSFSDSEEDGINICCGAFQLEEFGIKSVISNNVIEGNGGDGIDIESSTGLNIGPGNEIFENGTSSNDNGIEISWCMGLGAWLFFESAKVPANSNTITQNSIYDNFRLGIDLVGWDEDFDDANACNLQGNLLTEGVVGCDIYPFTAISPNDCIPFPDLQTQSGDKLIGVACSECIVEVFWADDDPSNNDDADGDPHGEGAEYIISGVADEDGSFSIDLPCDLGAGDLTATATDKLKNTSEFAENLVTFGTSSCATDTPLPTDTVVPTSTPAETDTPVPTNTLVPTNTPEPPKVCGDVNEDGVANSVDASLVLQLKAGLISSLPNESSGDVNGDGALTSVDAALLLQFTAGLIGEEALIC